MLHAVEYGTLKQVFGSPEQTITLNSGDVIEILSFGCVFTDNAWSYRWNFYKILPDDTEVRIYSIYTYDDDIRTASQYQIYQSKFVGPCRLVARSYASERGQSAEGLTVSVDYKITRASEFEYKNINIISIPEDAAGGETQVVVEASTDLHTWEPVHSSTVSGQKAFFRTRVTNNGE